MNINIDTNTEHDTNT